MSAPKPKLDDLALRRRRSRRTALVIGAIAVAIYAAFILSGVLAS